MSSRNSTYRDKNVFDQILQMKKPPPQHDVSVISVISSSKCSVYLLLYIIISDSSTKIGFFINRFSIQAVRRTLSWWNTRFALFDFRFVLTYIKFKFIASPLEHAHKSFRLWGVHTYTEFVFSPFLLSLFLSCSVHAGSCNMYFSLIRFSSLQ